MSDLDLSYPPRNWKRDLSKLMEDLDKSLESNVRMEEMPTKRSVIGEGTYGRVRLYELADGRNIAGKKFKINLCTTDEEELKKVSILVWLD